ncbi:MAG: DUF2225 domain-containing protein [Clostridia bacterium]|nr:DUF2225 domain-containing protein [Clostridia bacterium]
MSLMELKQIGKLVKFMQDDFIVSEGEMGDCMYILLDGQADVYLSSFTDTPIKVHEIQKGDFFGEMALLERMPRSATIIAATNTIAIRIDQSNFQLLLEKRTDIAMSMLQTLSARLRKTNEELLALKSGNYETNDGKLDLTGEEDCPSRHKEASAMPASEQVLEKDVIPSIGGVDKIPSIGGAEAPKPKAAADDCGKGEEAPDVIQILDLLPPQHSAYKYELYQEDYESNVLDKEVTCPICGEQFHADLIRTSKLMMSKNDKLFRKFYSNMNPLANNIWTCPICYYSQYFYAFHAVPVYKKEPLKELLGKIKPSIKVTNTAKDDINIVFIKYFLAIYMEEHTRGVSMINLAKCWLNLHWLYSDVNDEAMRDFALKKAHHYYKEAYYNSRLHLASEEELKLGVLVAELCTVCDEKREAYNLLARLIVDKQMSSQLKQYASNLMYETKLELTATK